MEGLILRLEQWHQGAQSDYHAHRYIMWGYYDQMQVFRSADWKGFEPASAVAQKADEPFNPDAPPIYHEAYPIKIVEPLMLEGNLPAFEQVQTEGYEFCYNAWENVKGSTNSEVYGGDYIAIAMLHFSGKAVAEINHSANESGIKPQALLNAILQEKIKTIAAQLGISAKQFTNELRCATYHTLGFGDMIIIFQTDRFDWVSDIVYALRKCRLPESATLLASTSYLMCGVSSSMDAQKLTPSIREAGERTRLSIRFLLRPGVSPQEFYKALQSYLDQRCAKTGTPCKLPRLETIHAEKNISAHRLHSAIRASHKMRRVNGRTPRIPALRRYVTPTPNALLFSQMYGYSDLLLLPNITLDRMLYEYVSQDGFMYPNPSFLTRYVLASRTSLRCIPKSAEIEEGFADMPAAATKQDTESPQAQTLLQCLKDCYRAIDRYKACRTDLLHQCDTVLTDQHPRLLRGLRHTLNLYRDLSQADHAYDIRSMIDPVIVSLTNCLEQSTILLSSYTQQANERPRIKNSKVKEQIFVIIKAVDENLQKFRHEFNTLLLDLLRGDRQFVEGRGMLYGAVGSATKLIFAYSQIVQSIMQCLRDQTYQPEQVYRGSALLTCGGSMTTQAHRLFIFLPPALPDTKRTAQTIEDVLLHIALPERTLYRVGASIYFLTHEVSHHVGCRASVERATFLQQSLAAYLVHIIASVLRDAKETFCQGLVDHCGATNAWDRRQMMNRIRARCDQQDAEFSQAAMQALMESICDAEAGNVIDGISSLSRYLPDLLSARFQKLLTHRIYFDPESITEWNHLAEKHFAFFVGGIYHRHLQELFLLLRGHAFLSEGGYSFLTHRFPELQELSREPPKLISMLFDTLLGNVYDLEETAAQEHVSDFEKNSDFPSLLSLQDAIPCFRDAFIESYVDVMSCTFLGCEPWEYLSVFLHENESPTLNALRDLLPHIVLRFGCTLSFCDPALREKMEAEDGVWHSALDKRCNLWESQLSRYGLWIEHENQRKGAAAGVHRYIRHIRKIMLLYRELYVREKIAEPLEAYVRICVQKQKDQLTAPHSTLYRQRDDISALFHKGMKMANDAQSQDQVWHGLLEHWMHSAEGWRETAVFH